MITPRAPRTIYLVGPTASGKTALALAIAEHQNGAIICADSRTVYQGLAIGTAAPTTAEQQRVRHYGLGLITPDQAYSAYQFKQMAQATIAEITAAGKLPIVVGGTGLYVDTLLFDMPLGSPPDAVEREVYQGLNIAKLQQLIIERGLAMPENMLNKRHLVRTLERGAQSLGRRQQPHPGAEIYGIAVDKATLQARIRVRAEVMFADSALLAEARQAAKRYGWDAPGLSGNIYRLLRQQLAGDITQAEALERFVALDWQLARRQMTWFRRNQFIHWGATDEIVRRARKCKAPE